MEIGSAAQEVVGESAAQEVVGESAVQEVEIESAAQEVEVESAVQEVAAGSAVLVLETPESAVPHPWAALPIGWSSVAPAAQAGETTESESASARWPPSPKLLQ